MPPKRRKSTDLVGGPEPKKRHTRSGTKAAVAPEAAPKSKQSSTPKAKEPKPSKSRADKSKPVKPEPKPKSGSSKASKAVKAKELENVGPKANTNLDTKNNLMNLTIKSALLKSPIQAQSWGSSPSPSSPTLIFTHGAGGTLSAPAVVNFCTGFSSSQPVLAFQGSMNLGARVKGFHACISHLEETVDDEKRLVLGGRSMGARAAVMAGSEAIKSSSLPTSVNLILVSYPLKGPKDVRDQILLDLPADVNVLFISGDRDSMCPLELLRGVMKEMKAQSWLVVVEGMDHGMHGKGERVLGERSGQVAAEWVTGERGETERVLNKDN